jgi:hypothetical protein
MGRARDWVARASPRTIPPLPHRATRPTFDSFRRLVGFATTVDAAICFGGMGRAVGQSEKAKAKTTRGAVLSFASTFCFNVLDPLVAIHCFMSPSPLDCCGVISD